MSGTLSEEWQPASDRVNDLGCRLRARKCLIHLMDHPSAAGEPAWIAAAVPSPCRAGRNEVLAPTCTHPAERVHSRVTLASPLGFGLRRRARSGARNPYHAKLAGGPILWV